MATKAGDFQVSGQQPRLTPGTVERLVSLGVIVLVAAAVAWGWWHRADSPVDPEQGLGYALGIVGGTMMLVLLGYPLRKRARPATRAPGSVGFWFRLHMLLGLLGPLAILYHSRFTWGALNSAMALGAMIVVASSGLVGRFFYSRVHRGYSGRKLELRALKQEMDGLLAKMEARGCVACRYADPMSGAATMDFPHNPNGSLNAIAGLCDPTGRIFGLMPHPEAYLYPENQPQWDLQNLRGELPAYGLGLKIFTNAVECLRQA